MTAEPMTPEQRAEAILKDSGVWLSCWEFHSMAKDIATSIRSAVKAEREACAALSESRAKRHRERCDPECKCADGFHIAAAIRARSTETDNG